MLSHINAFWCRVDDLEFGCVQFVPLGSGVILLQLCDMSSDLMVLSLLNLICV